MANYVVRTLAPANLLPGQFFQPGATRSGFPPSLTTFQNPSGSFVSMEGTGFAYVGDTDVTTAGTVTAITLYAPDFTVQWAAISDLSIPLVELYEVWLGAAPGDVFFLLLAGNDTVAGEDQNDTLVGHDSDDTITAGAGDDLVEPGAGDDTIDGGAGTRDILSYANASLDPLVTKGVVADLSAPSITDPWGGTDTFTGIEGLRGTKFADTLTGDIGANRFEGLAGNDTIHGGAGLDQVRYSRDAQYGGTAGVTVNLATGTAIDGFGNTDSFTGIEVVVGTNQADTLTGGNTPLSNGAVYEIYGLGGDDVITAGSFETYIEPGAGNDTITGGASSDQVSYAEYTGTSGAIFDLAAGKVTDPYGGTDTLFGSIEGVRGTSNADTITGNSLNNFIRGLGGDDAINGGSGTDMVRYDRDFSYGGIAGVTVDLAAGTATDGFGDTDTLASIENVRGSTATDLLMGDANANLFQGMAGADTIDGRDGLDTIDYTADIFFGGGAGVTVNLATGTATDGFGFTDTLTSIEIVRGTTAADTLTGGDAVLSGGNIWELRGLEGDDALIAGKYDALIFPGAGDDTITGGIGIDQISYEDYSGANGAIINLATGIISDPFGGTDTITSSGFEGVRATRNADTITGNAANNFFRALAGNDIIDGGDGFDQVRYDRDANAGGTKAVTVDLLAGTATDGFGNTDTLKNIENVRGTSQADTLLGDNLGNLFQGLGGADTLDGRNGLDIADYSADTLAAGITSVTVNLATGKATDGQGATDTLISIEGARGTGGADTLIGGDIDLGPGNVWNLQGRGGDDIILGGLGALYAEPGAGNDSVTGGASKVDQISYADFTNGIGVVVNLSKGSAIDPLGGTDSFSGLEGVRGTNFADTLTGDAGDNFFGGLAGNDAIVGGDGIDIVLYDRDINYGGTAGVSVDLLAGTATDAFGTKDTLSGIENIRGSNQADSLLGDNGDNRIQGLGGADVLNGRGGFNTVDHSRDAPAGGTAGVQVDLDLGSAVDGFGNLDTLLNFQGAVGSAQADQLRGSASANRLQGGLGDDAIDGRGGTDTAVFSGVMAQYSVTPSAGLVLVSGPDGTDSLTSIELLEFADGTLSIADSLYSVTGPGSKTEGTGAGTTDFSFVVERTSGAAYSHVIPWSIAGAAGAGTAPANAADFVGGVLPSGSVSFAPGQTKQTVTIPVARDTSVELNERFAFTLGAAPAGALIGVGSAQGIILNDDSAIAIAAASATRTEGSGGGTTPFTFTLTRSGATPGAQTVDWSVAGIAAAGTSPANAADFPGGVFPAGTVTFASGQTSQTLTIPVSADATVETNDRFAVTLANPSAGASLGIAIAQGVILNDDALLLSIAPTSATKPEGTGGTTAFTFTVTRTGDTAATPTVNWSVAGLAGAGTVPANATDFAGGVFPSGKVSFAPGQISSLITVPVSADAALELNDRFAITLASPSVGATLGTAIAEGIILNDDISNLAIAALSASKPEGTGAGATAFTFAVTRTSSAGVQTVGWSAAGTAGAGTAPADAADFAGGVLPSGTVSFAAGVTSQIVTVNVAPDALGELNERFAVTLSGASGGTPITTATALGTILNDDSSVAIGPAILSSIEGHSGTTAYSFTISRGGSTVAGQTVAWSAAGAAGSGTNPANAADFAGGVLPSGVVTFGAGQTALVVKVNVAGDTNVELNERFAVTLSAPSHGATLFTSVAQALILADDFASTAANQTLTGTDSSDIFLLGGGLDTVIGRAGLDSFRFQPSAIGPAAGNATLLQDFSRAAGEVIDLSAIDAIAGGVTTYAFNFINTAAFSGAAGQLRWQDNGAHRLIQGDVNGDMVADLTITTLAVGPVDATWFVL